MFARTIFDISQLAYTFICVMAFANVPPLEMSIHPITLFLSCTAISMLSGFAALARQKDEPITTRQIVSHVLNMGTSGAALSMILFATMGSRPNIEWWIMGGVGLFGLGGMASIEFAVTLGRQFIQFSLGKIKKVASKDD